MTALTETRRLAYLLLRSQVQPWREGIVCARFYSLGDDCSQRMFAQCRHGTAAHRPAGRARQSRQAPGACLGQAYGSSARGTRRLGGSYVGGEGDDFARQMIGVG